MAWLSSEHPLRGRAWGVVLGLCALVSSRHLHLCLRVSCKVPASLRGYEQESPLLPLEGRRMEEFVAPFLNLCSLSNSNEQGRTPRVPELSEEEGTIVCEQGGQGGDTREGDLEPETRRQEEK